MSRTRFPRPDVGAVRPDIQALRAIAVGLVVIYHLWPNRLSGGFVGVDIFFAISGFLIGTHLLTELTAARRVRLGRFWARRAKRLLPASLLVLLATTVTTLVVVPLGERTRYLGEILGSTFYVQNWVLAAKSVDYLTADDLPSPVQHFWSLSVEEQFYLALPLLLGLIALVTRRFQRQQRHVVTVVLVAVVAASLLYSISLTDSSPGTAYFSTWTRAWEFGLGVLLAAVSPRWPRVVAATIGWVGAAAIVYAGLTFSGATAFPGVAAAIPVLGAVAVLSTTQGPAALLGRLRPVTFIGDLSYSIYLWHWPMIVFLPIVTGVALRTVDKLGIAAATLLLAYLSTRFVEDPVRFSPRLLGAGRRPRAVGAWMLAATLVVAAASVGGSQWSEHLKEQRAAEADRILATTPLRCLGAGTGGGTSTCPDLGGTLLPDPANAADDDRNPDACWATIRQSSFERCTLPVDEPRQVGVARDRLTPDPEQSSTGTGRPLRVLAIGDSHLSMYFPLFDRMQRVLGWRVDVAGRAGCAWRPPRNRADAGILQRRCDDWRAAAARYLSTSRPYDLIVTTSLGTRIFDDDAREAAIEGSAELWRQQVRRGTRVVALATTPRTRSDVVLCTALHEQQANARCARTRTRAFGDWDLFPGVVDRVPGSALVDATPRICGPRRCDVVKNNVMVYRDGSHLSRTFLETLAPSLIDQVRDAYRRADASADAAP